MRVIYCGFFIEKAKFERFFEPKLAKAVDFPHITTAFRPSGTELHEDALGEKLRVRVVAYGNNGRNEGIKVEFVEGSAKAKSIFEQIRVPHITISVAEDAKPVDTAELDFEDLPNGAEFELRYGWYCADRQRGASIYFGGHR